MVTGEKWVLVRWNGELWSPRDWVEENTDLTNPGFHLREGGCTSSIESSQQVTVSSLGSLSEQEYEAQTLELLKP